MSGQQGGIGSVVIVDPSPATAFGIQTTIHRIARVVGVATTGRSTIDLLQRTSPDVIVLDSRLADVDTLALLDTFGELGVQARVLLRVPHDDEYFTHDALKRGVAGVITHDAELDALCHAVTMLMGEGRYLDPLLVGVVIDTAPRLTDRERQVLALASEGLHNRQIADRLGLGEETVKSHVSASMRKLDERSRTGAVARALRRGIIR